MCSVTSLPVHGVVLVRRVGHVHAGLLWRVAVLVVAIGSMLVLGRPAFTLVELRPGQVLVRGHGWVLSR
jgi:hypothetical protein